MKELRTKKNSNKRRRQLSHRYTLRRTTLVNKWHFIKQETKKFAMRSNANLMKVSNAERMRMPMN